MSQRINYKPSGINTDVAPGEAGDEVYTFAQNVVFHDANAERIGGLDEVFATPLFPPKFLIVTERGNDLFWVYASEENIGVWDGFDHTDLTPAGGITPNAVDDEWTGGSLNGLPVLNNQSNEPLFWTEDENDNFEILPGWPPNQRCNALRPFKFHLFAIGIQDGVDFVGDKIAWSSAADEGAVPATWEPLPTNEAGDDLLSETLGPCIDGLVLRGSLLIYKANSTYQVDYIGGNAVFSTRLLFKASGILGRNCAVEVDGVHYVFTAGDLIRHDGHTIQSLSDGRIRSEVFKQIDPEFYANSFVAWDPVQRSVWFCFPSNGNRFPNIAAVYSLDEDAWGLRLLHNTTPYATFGELNVGSEEMDETWEFDFQAWELDDTAWYEVLFNQAIRRLLQCDYVNTKLYAVDVGLSNDGELIEGYLQKFTMDLGDPSVVKTVSRIRPRVSGIAEIQIRLGSQDSPTDDISWGEYKPFPFEAEKLDYLITGRFISVEFFGDSAQPWGVYSFEIEFNLSGAW